MLFALTVGTMFMCSFGAAPSQVIPTGPPKIMVNGMPVFTITNLAFAPFAVCTSLGNPAVKPPFVPVAPCTPLITSWMIPTQKLKATGIPIISINSMAMCAFGGIIKPLSGPNNKLKSM